MMGVKRTRRKAAAVLLTSAAVIIAGNLARVNQFVWGDYRTPEAVTETVVFRPESVPDKDEGLRKEIEAEAAKRNIAPINAVNDRVWKAIPGYNGLEIDVDGSYYKTLQQRKQNAEGAAHTISFVYREISPSVSLSSLGPLPIYRGNPQKPMAALMINVAWGNEYLLPMLDTLDEEGVKATFFLDGSWLSKNADLAKEIQRRGHEIENHAYSHPNMSQLSRDRATVEITKTKQLLKDTLGVDNKWFAPPSGDFNQRTVEIAAEQGLSTVLWTVDTVDWRNPEPSSVVAKINKQAGAGSLILMHPTASSKQSLKGIIQVLKQKGLKLGTVAETLSPNRIKE